MATTRSLSTVPLDAPAPATALPGSGAPRHRLRAVDRDEVVDVTDLLPPGATWLPAPPHTLPSLPGRPPMVGYLVLVPADQQPPFAPVGVPAAPSAGAAGDDADRPGAPDHREARSHRHSPAPGSVRDPLGTAPAGPASPAGPAGPADQLVRIDAARRTAAVDGRELDLTYLEFELLAHLVTHPHRVHTRDQLVTTVWGYGHVGDGRTVDVHVARLRRKLGAEHRKTIQTVRRVGYKYTPPTGR
ncbi:winged helix-turn-helix domain-containing protein [Streptomyces olivaceus]|uniref:winged helix-turn-helix domain-containing protein n=1 Tax=Streptomyces olivaceus TaxID=47716 RepID=UPI001CCB8AB2|nr:winged helix-turn-helix domain-containing protein [Streptomyces olivaceus]MBZ6256101.1 winged helix-turn-helix domain-containing protein [Streptomyces olivaceus]